MPIGKVPDGHTWERQDAEADRDLIDPGPDPRIKPLRHQEKAYRKALADSAPPPLGKQDPRKGEKK